jgi:hypothetical protein
MEPGGIVVGRPEYGDVASETDEGAPSLSLRAAFFFDAARGGFSSLTPLFTIATGGFDVIRR